MSKSEKRKCYFNVLESDKKRNLNATSVSETLIKSECTPIKNDAVSIPIDTPLMENIDGISFS